MSVEYKIIVGDALESLKAMPDESVDCVVTSPPYWGLRDYGTASWDGGMPDCDHIELGVRGGVGEASSKQVTSAGASTTYQYRKTCKKCGAVRRDRQIGLERTPAEYVAKMVEVFREARRVLRKDGTCWLNLGDSYCNTNGYARAQQEYQRQGRSDAPANDRNLDALHDAGFKTKDLIGIPWRVAIALQDDGWYLRSDIIWSKPNPMPESVRDRPTKGHEYVFLLARNSKYWYDAEAIREESRGIDGPTRNARTVWEIAPNVYTKAHFATFPPELPRRCILAGCPQGGTVLDPFAGSGTTLATAIELGRNAIGIELNPSYAELIQERIMSVTPGMDL